ncbi:TetR/AcrR family transcriptional regulator [Solwaraspora sp. WMMB335]|uniref:TetR/AcrR family transcriptional regulator n=1 Tax=Solwaraspora sp. WMMB335 TaxID=3404118 RepID=UPI003B923978
MTTTDFSASRRDSLTVIKRRAAMARIRNVALDLFEEGGYRATTIDQIAHAAEVAPASIFRYFGSKEQIVLRDDVDEGIVVAFSKHAARLTPVAAMRAALEEVDFDAVLAGDGARRLSLTLKEPELASASATATQAMGLRLGRVIAGVRGREGHRVVAEASMTHGAAIAAVLHHAIAAWHGAGALPDLKARLLRALNDLEEIS